MILKGKNAVIYGAAGSMGSALAKVFAEAGVLLFLTGRNHQTLKSLADEILLRGGKVEASK